MKRFTALALFALFACGGAYAADNPQQTKMKACNSEASGKTGDDRKAFMKTCLSNKPTKAMTQQEKMGQCNKDATGKSGDDRKKYMSDCLKKK